MQGHPTEKLFIYGTLLPRITDGLDTSIWASDSVRGRLYDLGEYPGLVDLDDATAGWVDGLVRVVDSVLLETWFDDYEGVAEGLFHRVRTITRNGRRVWIYVYGLAIEDGARGPLESWDGRRGVWPSG